MEICRGEKAEREKIIEFGEKKLEPSTWAKPQPLADVRDSSCSVREGYLKSEAVAEVKVVGVTNIFSSAPSGCTLGFYLLTRVEVMLVRGLGLVNESNVSRRDVWLLERSLQMPVHHSTQFFPLSLWLVIFQMVQVSVVFISEWERYGAELPETWKGF